MLVGRWLQQRRSEMLPGGWIWAQDQGPEVRWLYGANLEGVHSKGTRISSQREGTKPVQVKFRSQVDATKHRLCSGNTNIWSEWNRATARSREEPATGRSGPDLPGHSEEVTPDLETLGNS